MVSDIETGKIYILRGLKIAAERAWNGATYVNDPQGTKKLESDARTAFEDVSDQPDIMYYFYWLHQCVSVYHCALGSGLDALAAG